MRSTSTFRIILSLLPFAVAIAGVSHAQVRRPPVPPNAFMNPAVGQNNSPSAVITDPPGNSERPPVTPEHLFIAIEPCTLFDTRKTTILSSARDFLVTGTSSLSAQGGSTTGCGIPATASSIHLALTTLSSTGTGYVEAYPKGSSETKIRALSYQKAIPMTAETTTRIGHNGKISMKSLDASTHVVGYVTGYYVEQIHGMISPSGAVYSGSNRILGATVLSTGEYDVTFDRDVSDCTPMIDTYNVYVYGSAFAFNGNHVTVFTWSLNSSTHLEQAESDYFYISVKC